MVSNKIDKEIEIIRLKIRTYEFKNRNEWQNLCYELSRLTNKQLNLRDNSKAADLLGHRR